MIHSSLFFLVYKDKSNNKYKGIEEIIWVWYIYVGIYTFLCK